MNKYIATFFTHYDAILLRKKLEQVRISCQLMPVPRSLSSSCGTCAAFVGDLDMSWFAAVEIEQLLQEDDDGFKILLDNR